MKRQREESSSHFFSLPIEVLELIMGHLTVREIHALGRALILSIGDDECWQSWWGVEPSHRQLSEPALQPYLQALRQALLRYWPTRIEGPGFWYWRLIDVARGALESERILGAGMGERVADRIRSAVDDPLFATKHFLLNDLCNNCEDGAVHRVYWCGTPGAPELCRLCASAFEKTKYRDVSLADYPKGLAFVTYRDVRLITRLALNEAAIVRLLVPVRCLDDSGTRYFFLRDVLEWASAHTIAPHGAK